MAMLRRCDEVELVLVVMVVVVVVAVVVVVSTATLQTITIGLAPKVYFKQQIAQRQHAIASDRCERTRGGSAHVAHG